eukprot:evm.model.scf_706.1 EVM.evm.TU.scf_706.1   scf_706:2431-5274(+)
MPPVARKRKAQGASGGARGRGRGGGGRGRGRGRARADGGDAVREQVTQQQGEDERSEGPPSKSEGEEEWMERLRQLEAWLRPRAQQLRELGMRQKENVNQWMEETIGLLPQEIREMPWEVFCRSHLPPGAVIAPTNFTKLKRRTSGDKKETAKLLADKGPELNRAKGVQAEEKVIDGQDEKQPRPIRQGETVMLFSSQGSMLGKAIAQYIKTPNGTSQPHIEMERQQDG